MRPLFLEGLFLEVSIFLIGSYFAPPALLHNFCCCKWFCLWDLVLFTYVISNVDYRCLLEIRILLSPSCKQTGFHEWLKKSVPLQIITVSYGPKCIILLIVDMVSDYLF